MNEFVIYALLDPDTAGHRGLKRPLATLQKLRAAWKARTHNKVGGVKSHTPGRFTGKVNFGCKRYAVGTFDSRAEAEAAIIKRRGELEYARKMEAST